MTIEELKTLAAGLYKGAEEATPIVGDGEKKEWMSNRLNEIIENEEPGLNCLLGFTPSEVIEQMEKEYELREDETTSNDLSCATATQSDDDFVELDTVAPQCGTKKKEDTPVEATVITSVGYVDPGIIIEEQIVITDEMKPTEGSCGCK